jgi:hypothetical protein
MTQPPSSAGGVAPTNQDVDPDSTGAPDECTEMKLLTGLRALFSGDQVRRIRNTNDSPMLTFRGNILPLFLAQPQLLVAEGNCLNLNSIPKINCSIYRALDLYSGRYYVRISAGTPALLMEVTRW